MSTPEFYAVTTAAKVGDVPPPPNVATEHRQSDSGVARPLEMAAGFDSEGFAGGEGLRKDLFYWTPFLTCAKCNTLAVVDAAKARSFAAVLGGSVAPAAAAAAKPEPLPRCETCGSNEHWWEGSHNLLGLLGANKAELERRIVKEKRASSKMQAAYRRYLSRRWAR